jgi:hypothetical protein
MALSTLPLVLAAVLHSFAAAHLTPTSPLSDWLCSGERGGPKGPEPTRFGDWERKGRVSDF